MSGLKKFLLRGNLVELAVAVVIGSQFAGLVTQFVKSFVSPLLALVGGNPNLSSFQFTIRDSTFEYGDFISAAITFLISALVVYFILVLPVARLLALLEGHKDATTRDCPLCLSSIPIAARRCPQCTSEITPATEQPKPIT